MAFKLVFHPSLISYDTKKVFTRSKYKKRRDHNKMVKRFRDIVGCKEEYIKESRKKRDFIMKQRNMRTNMNPLWKSISDIVVEKLRPNMSKWLLTYRLKSTDEIYSDVMQTADSPAHFLKYVAEQWFDDDDAELISITRL